MNKKRIHVTELVLRDGHQSLIATRMQTADMLPICGKLDQAGFWSLEAWGGATFDACVRFLREDPWERLARLRAALPNSRIQMLLRGQNLLGYRHYSDDVVRAFVKKAADRGVDVFRVFDAMNDLRNLRVAIQAVKAAGRHAEGAICYTVSPVHDIPHFVELARGMAGMGCDTIAIKDMAGLLTPYTAFELVQAIITATGLPVHTHSHATSGLAHMTHLKAVEAGATIIDTCIGAFAEGASHPTTQSMVAALEGSDYDTGLSLPLLEEISAYFKETRKKYWQFESDFTGTDTRVLVNQVPGGMISNLANQLKEQGAIDRMDEVLAEIPAVRRDLGYPPLVTPTSQIVGNQAALNVLTGERYKSVATEVKLYLQGRYGRAPGAVDPDIRQRAIGDAEIVECRPADLIPDELDRLASEAGTLAQSEEDVLTYAMFPELARTWLAERADNRLKPETLKPREPAGLAPQTAAPQVAANEFHLTLHGETYHIKVSGSGRDDGSQRPYFVAIDGVSEEVVVEVLSEVEIVSGPGGAARKAVAASGGNQKPRATHPGHVTAAMPGNVVDVLVKVGQKIAAGDGVLVIEAMKMENEVAAPVSGTVVNIYCTKGEAVTPDMALVEIQPE